MQSRNISKVSLPRIKIKQTSSAVQRALVKFRTRSADFLKALSSFRWMVTGEDVMFLYCVCGIEFFTRAHQQNAWLLHSERDAAGSIIL
jgi:hypothetical protein